MCNMRSLGLLSILIPHRIIDFVHFYFTATIAKIIKIAISHSNVMPTIVKIFSSLNFHEPNNVFCFMISSSSANHDPFYMIDFVFYF